MLQSSPLRRFRRRNLGEGFALFFLLLFSGLALAGPSGLLAWGENLSLLERRQSELRLLAAQRDELRNRVALLNPRHADPDLTGELLRKDLNVVHPDELVILLR